jgi:hypothetical protein
MATAELGTLLRHIRQLATREADWTDHQLMDTFAARRDEAAFTTLVARHGPMVLRVCRRVLQHATLTSGQAKDLGDVTPKKARDAE